MRSRGDSFDHALHAVRSALLVLADAKADRTVTLDVEPLIASHPHLQAGSLAKKRQFTDLAVQALLEQGADRPTALLAGHVGEAVFECASSATYETPELLAEAIEKEFTRLSKFHQS